MSDKRVIATIDRRGNTTIDAEGFTGTSCLDATKSLQDALQGVVTRDDPKPEMYESDSASDTVAQQRF